MPRYFFHIRPSDKSLVSDDEGGVFQDFEAAMREAVAIILGIAADAARSGNKPERIAIEIADENGKPLGSVQAQDVFS